MTTKAPWPDRPMAERSLRVAITGYVHNDDPTIIADMQQSLDLVPQAIRAAENDALERAAKVAMDYAFDESWRHSNKAVQANAAQNIAAVIRALKHPEPKG